MNQTIIINCYKTSHNPEIGNVAAFFNLQNRKEKPDYILLRPEQISTALKISVTDKYAWLFKFGCICLVNFEATETYSFLKFLEGSYGKIDFDLFSTYNETHKLDRSTLDSKIDLLKAIESYAIILAKSTELKSLEAAVTAKLDQSEQFVNDLHHGLPNPSSKLLIDTTLSIIRFKLNVIYTLKILDRPTEYNAKLKLRQFYDHLAEYYELDKRFDRIFKKIADLNEITTDYLKIGHNRKEQRLLILEVFLLTLFPLSQLFDHLLPTILTFLKHL
jgi:uncharacterized Rmd1/YagE family protein